MTQRSKTAAAWLALLLGGLGAHWFYLQGSRGWKPWIYVMLFPVSMLAGFAEAIYFGLMPDEKWQQRHGPAAPSAPRSGALAVAAAVLGLGLGATGLTAFLAMLIQWLLTGSIA